MTTSTRYAEHRYEERRSALLPATVWRRIATAGTSRIQPDGCMDLIWTGDRILLAGPDTTTVSYVTDRPSILTAVRFRPGVAPVVLGCRADELVNVRLDLADLWPAHRNRRWVDVLTASTDPAGALERLAAHQLVASGGVPEWLAPATRMLVAGESVSDVAGRIGASPRQLQRRSRRHFGYGPKTLQRILRVDRAAGLLRAGGELSEVAYRSGFADYSHMFRDFRGVTGEQPAAFRPAVGPEQPRRALDQPSGA